MQSVETDQKEKQGKKVVVIDYHLGNLFSVKQACITLGIDAEISSDKKKILGADALILPGVGAFREAMQNLEKLDLIAPIHEKVSTGTPFFGVCLGQQLLFTESEEFGSGKGLDIIPGSIKKFNGLETGKKLRVPQIAWNKIHSFKTSWKETPFKELEEDEFMYFVHSYYVKPADEDCILSTTIYEDIKYCSSIIKNNIFATQFHPEKSSVKGLSIYRNWAQQNNLI